jgi:hypothetical protein
MPQICTATKTHWTTTTNGGQVMDANIIMNREVAEELECLLRVIARSDSSHASYQELHEAGLREAVEVFADELEAAIDDARYNG